MSNELKITDPEAKKKLIARLARIDGQIRGLQDMIEQEQSCEQIAQQIAAVRGAFNKVFAEVIADEIEALEASRKDLTEALSHVRLKELVKILSKYA